MDKDFVKLLSEAEKVVGKRILSDYADKGRVACALLCQSGKIYTGVDLNAKTSIGFCAEVAAIADMIKHNETRILKLVALSDSGVVYPPCGRCRELVRKINHENADTQILLDKKGVKATLRELLPHMWVTGRVDKVV